MFNKILLSLASVLFLLLSISSVVDDSLIRDESEHLAAAWGYQAQPPIIWNTIHPPLVKWLVANAIKGIAAPKLSDMDVKYIHVRPARNAAAGMLAMPQDGPYNPNRIISVARLVVILFNILLLGVMLYVTTWFLPIGLATCSTVLYAFSPTFLAHSRHILYDCPVASLIYITSVCWLKYLNTNKQKFFWTTVFFGLLAILTKFSAFLLFPWCLFLMIVCKKFQLRKFLLMCLLLLGFSITFFYLVLPSEKLIDVGSYPWIKIREWPYSLRNIINLLDTNPSLRIFAWFLYSVSRSFYFIFIESGSTSFFNGQYYSGGRWYVLPAFFFLKEPIIFLLALIVSIFVFINSLISDTKKIVSLPVVAALFCVIYLLCTFLVTINMGLRYLLPMYPFICVLIVTQVNKINRKLTYFVVASQLTTAIMAYPFYVSYFNFLSGGTDNGYKWGIDSNYDWGQDLVRLKETLQANQIDYFYLDYAGGDLPARIFGSSVQLWKAENLKPPSGSYLAVSIWILQAYRANRSKNAPENSLTEYRWLDELSPITVGGKTIFVYKVP